MLKNLAFIIVDSRCTFVHTETKFSINHHLVFRQMENNYMPNMSDAIFSTSVKGGGKTYFFDVKQAKAGPQSKFVQVTESRLYEGQPKRSSITIFPDQLQAFIDAFKASVAKVN